MHYFVDGYNLLFRILRAGDDLARERQFIIQDLNQKIQKVGIDVTIVFDSHYRIGESVKSHYNHIAIQFTATGETADEFILSELRRSDDPRMETVVTSDKKLAWYARRKLAKTETVEEFVAWLNKRYRNKIRLEKEQPKSSLPTEPPQKPLAKAPRLPKPEIKASAEECFDFYLKQFEESFSKNVQEEKPASEAAVRSTRKKTRKKFQAEEVADTKKYLSDMERWLDIFENKLKI